MAEQIAVCDTSLDEGAYVPDAILFDGTTDIMLREADLTGLVDGKLGLVSFWYRLDGGDGLLQRILSNNTDRFVVRRRTTNDFQILAGSIVPTFILQIISSTTDHVASVDWHHFMASWDLLNTTAQMFIDDVDVGSSITATNEDIDYTATDWGVGAQTAGGSKLEGALSDPYFTTEFLDLDVVANRRKFIDANGDPVFPGNAGELPTGTASLIYLRGNRTDQGINSGTGGDFVSQATQVPGETPGPVVLTTGTFPRSWNGL